jgi:septal ring factor EnvC (AmiA/AmiB activator)
VRFMDSNGVKQDWVKVSKGKPQKKHLEECSEPISVEWARLADVKHNTHQVAQALAKWRMRATAQRSAQERAQALAQMRATRLAMERTTVVVDMMPKLKGAWFLRTAKGGRPELQLLHAELLAKQDQVCMAQSENDRWLRCGSRGDSHTAAGRRRGCRARSRWHRELVYMLN